MKYEDVFNKAAEWMLIRGWKNKVAKSRDFNQSLFEHSLFELDMALCLLPIFKQPNHFNLSDEEEKILIVSLVAHDVGKERPEWQDYILGRGEFLSDIAPALTKKVLSDLCTALGFPDLDQMVMSVIENCVNLHMSRERSDTNVVMAILKGADRWYTLANLVYHIDNVCSAKGIFAARNALERSLLGKHLKVAYHQVNIRGVSTTALHRAALESFQDAGWIPILHFSDATLYVCSAAQPVQVPTPTQIETRLAKILGEIVACEVTPLVVGREMQNFLPKPDLFDYREIKTYLYEASKRANPLSFKKKPRDYRHKVVEKYLTLQGCNIEEISDSVLDIQSERISSARPEMAVFRFFKCAMGPELIGVDGISLVEQEYDLVFGEGAWIDLKSMSTYMPALDMAKRIDRFWKLPGKKFKLKVLNIEELSPEKRLELLIDTLNNIARKVYAAIPNPPTRATLACEMATSFIQDLVYPTSQIDLRELARQQMEFYAISKPFAGKQTREARYICPICNIAFENGIKAAADFIDKPESHSNRGVAHGTFGYITICKTCKYERILRQLLLGERASELIVIFPRMNIGPGAGELLVRKAKALYDRAYTFMVGDTEDPDRRLWLAFTSFIAEQVLDKDFHRLTPDKLIDLLTYRSGEKNRQKNRRQLEKAIKENYDDDLKAANIEWGTDFATWDDAINEVISNRVVNPTVRKIRAEVYKLYPQMKLVCQTPHLVIFPVSYYIKLGDDSETNEALRRTFIALLIGLCLDVSVAIVQDSDQIDFQGGEGVAFVPPVASARELIGANWVPLDKAEHWFKRIGVASILANSGQYSARSGLFEVLTAPTAGHVLRRIEQKRSAENQALR
ncbi:MAG: hypothetical protein JRI96_17340, partial [Deltaproteobacteria bacterium]|nr:hypothetical protein [Deltaproteobacteria bacterium]